MQVVAVGIHRMPELLVQIDRELAVAREIAQRFLFEEELRIIVEVVEDLAFEEKECTSRSSRAW